MERSNTEKDMIISLQGTPPTLAGPPLVIEVENRVTVDSGKNSIVKPLVIIMIYKFWLKMWSTDKDNEYVVNCPNQPTCFAHFDLCICKLCFIIIPLANEYDAGDRHH